MHKSAFALVATAFVLLPHAAVLGQGLPQAVRPQAAEAAVTVDPALRKSVIKIAVKQEMRDPSTPWKRESPEDFGGSGVVIAPGRVLTNAHVVEQTSEIMLETDQTALPVQAELLAIDRTRDLALLEVKDEAFNRDHPPIPLFEGLPKEGSRVTVMGFPMGGDALSTTSGVISRIEWAEIGQGGEDGMRVQVDAAINFGNSGGPAFVDGKVAGLAFSGLMGSADNISYLLATEEIVRFLDEAAAGRVDGNTVLNLEVQTLENPALRAKLGASGDVAGVVVIDQKGGPLQAWDIIVKINGQAVDNKGQVTIEGDRKVAMDCVVGRFVPTAEKPNHVVEILREGKPAERKALLQELGIDPPAAFDPLDDMFEGVNFSTATECVTVVAGKLLDAPLSAEQQSTLVAVLGVAAPDSPFVPDNLTDDKRKELLHLITSMAEYQLC